MKLHIGCGKRDFGKDWLHIDAADFPHVRNRDVHLKEAADNSADTIYSSHFIEYFDRQEVLELLQQWNRVLKPGGDLLMAVPDFEAIAKMYANKDYEIEAFLGPIYGQIEINGSKSYHKTAYDFKSLCRVLAQCGFKGMLRVDDILYQAKVYDQDDHSRAVLPHMSAEGTSISLNIIATK